MRTFSFKEPYSVSYVHTHVMYKNSMEWSSSFLTSYRPVTSWWSKSACSPLCMSLEVCQLVFLQFYLLSSCIFSTMCTEFIRWVSKWLGASDWNSLFMSTKKSKIHRAQLPSSSLPRFLCVLSSMSWPSLCALQHPEHPSSHDLPYITIFSKHVSCHALPSSIYPI